MIPIILVSSTKQNTKDFIQSLKLKEDISDNYIFEIFPKVKEISIDQIREIKKNIVYSFSQKILIILYDFDTASYEAQNAFLKALEEHGETIQFLLVVSNFRKLAPTVVSRSKIINTEIAQVAKTETKLTQKLEEFIASGHLKMLGDQDFQAKSYETPGELFDQLIYFFQNRLDKDPNATKILRQILKQKYLVENNNIDSQSALDHVLIATQGTYHKSTA